MGVLRRILLPVALGVVTVAAAVGAVVLDQGEATADADGGDEAVVTPVLSPRRLPELITTPGADLTLRLRLIELLGTAPPDSCLVVEADGREVLAHQPDTALVPASTHKTLVGAAILETLGPEHRFSTELQAGGMDGAGVVQGDAWLVGGGDPQLSSDAFAATDEREEVARTSMEDLADAIAAAGVTRITGRLVADETRYDTDRTVGSWRPVDGITSPGPLSALAVNDGFSSFPTSADPAAPRVPSPDPPRSAAATLAFLLAERGVAVDGGIAVGAAPDGAVVLAAVESAPLDELVGQMLTYSDNHSSELLLKELGLQEAAAGTTAAGADAVGQVLAQAGVDVSGATFVDGSGLSDTNLVTCDLLAAALAEAGPDSPLGAGLSVAGESGTLASLFRDTPAQGRLLAKTGSLNDVRSLAGFVTNDVGDDLVFSLLINRPPFVEDADVELRTNIALALADYPQRPPIADVEPVPVER